MKITDDFSIITDEDLKWLKKHVLPKYPAIIKLIEHLKDMGLE